MKNVYYVVEKQLQNIDGFEEATGWKYIRVYDIDTQCFNLIVITELDVINSVDTEKRIKEELELLDYNNFNLVQL